MAKILPKGAKGRSRAETKREKKEEIKGYVRHVRGQYLAPMSISSGAVFFTS